MSKRTVTFSGDRSKRGTVGAPYLTACGSKVYWELRVSVAKGYAWIGLAGTSFRSGPQAPVDYLGTDEASWALFIQNGKRIHGCAPPPMCSFTPS